jgi:S1-C subfamily serine protease
MSNTPSVMPRLTLFFLVVVLSATAAVANPNLPTATATAALSHTTIDTTIASAYATPQPSSPSSPSSPFLLLQTSAAQPQSPSQSQQHTQLLQQSPGSQTAANSTSSTANSSSSSNSYAADLFNLQSRHLNSIFEGVQNSVVQITSKVPAPPSSPSSPPSPPADPSNPGEGQNVTALGSGFVYDTKGHIITNNHVVSKAKVFDVTFTDGNRYTASVAGKDPFSDLAVLKIIENLTRPLVPLGIANSSNLEIGDQVIAIGNPYGLDNTMTTGIVSQTGRLLPEYAGYSIPDVIQTDASINPGNSGGPLLNIKGEVIGMNTAGLYSGVGFAISSNTITREAPVLMQNGNFTHSYLGLSGVTLTSDMAPQFENLSKTFRGVYVNTIVKDGPADKAGLRGVITDYYGQKHGGDVVTALDKQNITKTDELITYIDQHTKPGDTVTLTVYRDGHYVDLALKLEARPLPPELPSDMPDYP